MDRRALLALIASLPVLVPGAAQACILRRVGPDYIGRQNAQVRRLFEAWWARDLAGFRAMFTIPLEESGRPVDPTLVRAFRNSYRLPRGTRALFDRFFTNRGLSKRVRVLINTDMGIIALCTETDDMVDGIVNCDDPGQSHLFHVAMSGINPTSITHITSESQGEAARAQVWTDDSP